MWLFCSTWYFVGKGVEWLTNHIPMYFHVYKYIVGYHLQIDQNHFPCRASNKISRREQIWSLSNKHHQTSNPRVYFDSNDLIQVIISSTGWVTTNDPYDKQVSFNRYQTQLYVSLRSKICLFWNIKMHIFGDWSKLGGIKCFLS